MTQTGIIYDHSLGWVDNPNHTDYGISPLCLGVQAHINLDEAVERDTKLNATVTVQRPRCYSCGENIDDTNTALRMVACEDGCHIKLRCETCKNGRKVVKATDIPPLPIRF